MPAIHQPTRAAVLAAFLIVSALLLGAVPTFGQLAAKGCGGGSPAFPVPEAREMVTVWPPDFRPGLPDQQLPANRDSTDYVGLTIPGVESGHELFQAVDLANDFLYVAYNAGLQVWSVGGPNVESPQRLAVADGWRGDFTSFPVPGELDLWIEDVAARPEPGSADVLVALGGRDTVGFSLWRHRTATNILEQISQLTAVDARQVRLAELDGTLLAFAVGSGGVQVINATTGALLGALAGDTTSRRYLDVIEGADSVYIAASAGNATPARLWELTNPVDPSTAVVKFDGATLGSGVRGVALFEANGAKWLGLVQGGRLKIFTAETCLDFNGCTDLGNAFFDAALPSSSATTEFLTFSQSLTTPYLYYGPGHAVLSGTRKELLYDLTNLGTPSPLSEITDAGGTYTDPCNALQVDYWGDYYAGNGNGLRGVAPRAGKWNGVYFYRAATSILDVHRRSADDGGAPQITTTVVSPEPHWMSTPSHQHAIQFFADALNCSGPGVWGWFDDDVFPATVADNGSTATFFFDVCKTTGCADRTVEVWGLKDTCLGDPQLVQNRATVTLREPRAEIDTLDIMPPPDIGGGRLNCAPIDFSAGIEGKAPFAHAWTVRDPGGAVLATGTSSSFSWTPDLAVLEPIFLDGFESGNATAWSVAVGLTKGGSPLGGAAAAPPPRTVTAQPVMPTKGVSVAPEATVDVELVVTNLSGSHQTSTTVPVLVRGLGLLGSPSIARADLGGGRFTFTASAANATEYRWEIEDPANGSAVGCRFYAVCQIFDWGTAGAELAYQWMPPNTPGIYGATVEVRNCQQSQVFAGQTFVDVTSVEALQITRFEVDGVASLGCTFLPLTQTWDCQTGTEIVFIVEASGHPDSYEIDWDNDGSFEETFAAGALVSHIYATTGSKDPQIRAVSGLDLSVEVGLAQSLTLVD